MQRLPSSSTDELVILERPEGKWVVLKRRRTTVGWAARDSSGILSPYTYTLRSTGPEDVYIKVMNCGICHSDLHQIKNELGQSNYPMVCRPTQGGFAKSLVADQKFVVKIPEGMAPEQVAPLLCAGE
ncbi:hypothetical protein M0R45_007684 [Rubus argutus]|uniref:Cinnamyl alcohol dehydrogenase n=1 Tax=Rubus argutus TaxID=59490 RepID=A0AAW1XZD3_RUBAR